MLKNDVIQNLEWSDFYEAIRSYGISFIDDSLSSSNAKKVGDTHTIVRRIVGRDIPEFISDKFHDISHIQIFACEPHTSGFIHKDGIGRYSALNIPLTDPDGSLMEWYDDAEFTEYFYEGSGTTLVIAKEELLTGKHIGSSSISQIIDRPCIVNTNVWHRVDNRMSSKCRWVLSIRFKTNPSFNTLSTILS